MAPARFAHRRAHLGATASLVAALSLVVASCAGTARNPFAAPGSQEAQVFVQVENRGFSDLRLYALSSRGSQSLGPVEGNTTRRVTLDWRQPDQISFRMEVLAGRSYATHSISVNPGDHVYLTIPSDPSSAYLQVR